MAIYYGNLYYSVKLASIVCLIAAAAAFSVAFVFMNLVKIIIATW